MLRFTGATIATTLAIDHLKHTMLDKTAQLNFPKNDLVILDSLKPEARSVPHPYPASVGSHPKPCACQVD